MNQQIYHLRKINPNSWSGIRLYQFSNEDIGPGVDDQGLPITGLTENYYVENSKGNKELVKGTREQLELDMGLDQGTLKKGSLHKPNDFWINYAVRIGEGEEKFDTTIPEHRLAIEFLKAQPQVAFGVKNIKAKSEYLLYTREEEARQSNTEKKSKRDAYVMFEKLTLDDMAEILQLTGVKTGAMSKDAIEDALTDFLEAYPDKFKAMVNDPIRKFKTFINKALDKGILSLDGGAVMYNEIMLGYDKDSAAVHLSSPDGAKNYEALKIQMGMKPKPKTEE